jgi:hypothetical protein
VNRHSRFGFSFGLGTRGDVAPQSQAFVRFPMGEVTLIRSDSVSFEESSWDYLLKGGMGDIRTGELGCVSTHCAGGGSDLGLKPRKR